MSGQAGATRLQHTAIQATAGTLHPWFADEELNRGRPGKIVSASWTRAPDATL